MDHRYEHSSDARIALVLRMFRAWEDLDWPSVTALFAPDAVLHSVMSNPAIGREAIAEDLSFLAGGLTRIRLNVKDIGVIGGRVFVERVDDFDFNGHHGQVPAVGILRVDADYVTEWIEYYDRPTLLRGMGLLTDRATKRPN